MLSYLYEPRAGTFRLEGCSLPGHRLPDSARESLPRRRDGSLFIFRTSAIDLDFFCPDAFRSEYLAARFKDIFESTEVEILQEDRLILFLGSHKTKLSLFRLPYPLLKPLELRQLEGGASCPLASLDDIAAMKALAIIQRGTAKDFIDLFSILRETGYSFSHLAALVRTKYGLGEDFEYHLKTALVYFEDAEPDARAIVLLEKGDRPRLMIAEEWKAVREFFIRFIR
jgi:hypothetical protein